METIKVGDVLFTRDLTPRQVTKVGRKYFYVSNRPEPFVKETLEYRGYRTIQLYKDKQTLSDSNEVEDNFRKIQSHINKYYTGSGSNISLDKLREIVKILDL